MILIENLEIFESFWDRVLTTLGAFLDQVWPTFFVFNRYVFVIGGSG